MDPSGNSLRQALADFLPPARADMVAADLAAAHDGDGAVAAAVVLLVDEYGAADEDVAISFGGAGVAAVRLADLLGVDLGAVNEWLDEEAALPARDEPVIPRTLVLARSLVRLGWVVVALVLAGVLVQAGGSLLPCRAAVCLGDIELEFVDGRTASADDGLVVRPREVATARFAHRAAQDVDGIVRWTVDGAQLSTTAVSMDGDGVLVVQAPPPPLPVGVHVVELETDEVTTAAVFSVERQG